VALFVGTVLFTINQLDCRHRRRHHGARRGQDQPHLPRALLRFKLWPPRWAPRTGLNGSSPSRLRSDEQSGPRQPARDESSRRRLRCGSLSSLF
jgi:hypothetical protein